MPCALYHDNLSSPVSHILNCVSPLYIQSNCLLFIAVGLMLLTGCLQCSQQQRVRVSTESEGFSSEVQMGTRQQLNPCSWESLGRASSDLHVDLHATH